jgi:glycosyltransferase involved in cell wall biosynthesis
MTDPVRHLLVFDASLESDPYLCWLYAAQFLTTAKTEAESIGFMPLFPYRGPNPARLGMKLISASSEHPRRARRRSRSLTRFMQKLGLADANDITVTSLTLEKRHLLKIVERGGSDLGTVILFGNDPGDVVELAKLVHVGCREIAPAMVAVARRPVLNEIMAVGLRQLGIPVYVDIGFEYGEDFPSDLPAGFAGAFSFWSDAEYPFPAQRGPEADWSIIRSGAFSRPRAPMVLFLRPDWPNCGSYTTFKNIAMRYAQRGTVILDVALDENKRKYSATDASERLRDSHRDLSPAITFAAARSRSLEARRARRVAGHGLVEEHVSRFTQAATPDWLRDMLRASRPDYAYVNHYFTLGYLKRLGLDIPFILDTHDIQSVNYIHHRYSSKSKGRSETFSELLEKEISYFHHAKSIAFVNADELELVASKLPHLDLFQFIAIPGTAPTTVQRASDAAIKNDGRNGPRILIVASRNPGNEANIDWFLAHVWPCIEPTGATLDLVGTISSWVAQKKAIPPSWTLHGAVPSVAPFYARADLVALPVIRGAGVAIKTIEALRYGKLVCATSHAFRGLGKSVQALFPRIDDASSFAEELKRLIEDPVAAQQRLAVCRRAADYLSPERFDEEFDKRHWAMLERVVDGPVGASRVSGGGGLSALPQAASAPE